MLNETRSTFILLKPYCVALNNAALKDPSAIDGDAVTARLDALHTALLLSPNDDARLAHYIFYPITNVLKVREYLPRAATEKSLLCINVLLNNGWQKLPDFELFEQLLVFLTLTCKEFTTEALTCMHSLFYAAKLHLSMRSRALCGQSVVMTLELLRSGSHALLAAQALEAFVSVADFQLVKIFVPGIVSSLFTILTERRRPFRLLERCLAILTILIGLLKDESAWVNHTVARIGPMLERISRLASHDRDEVKQGCKELAFAVLRCGALETYSDCAFEMIVDLDDTRGVEKLLEHERNSEKARVLISDWIVTLPRLPTQDHVLARIAKLHGVLYKLGEDMDVIDDILVDNIIATGVSPQEIAAVRGNEHLHSILRQLAQSPAASKILWACYRNSQVGARRNAHLWLAVTLLDVIVKEHETLRDLVQSSPADLPVLDDMYEAALSRATNQETGDIGLDLQIIALRARVMRETFQGELPHCLYPLVHLAGQGGQVREAALVCLGAIATACGYTDVRHLLVANVDYLVDALGVKFQTQDISPQTPLTMTMMVQLCGSELIPHLQDTIDGILRSLEYFHGYEVLTAMLFQSLLSVVNVAEVKVSDKHLKRARMPLDVSIALEFLCLRPRHDTLTEDAGQANSDPFSSPSVYEALHRIVEATQYHLGSPDHVVRTLVVAIIASAIPALATNEDRFLPLLHTLWPSLVPRLLDTRSNIVATALQVVSAMCRCAGDFMSGRVDEIWPILLNICKRGGMSHRVDLQSVSAYASTPGNNIGTASVELVECIVTHVRIDNDKLMDLIGLGIKTVRTIGALASRNADAVWLSTLRSKDLGMGYEVKRSMS